MHSRNVLYILMGVLIIIMHEFEYLIDAAADLVILGLLCHIWLINYEFQNCITVHFLIPHYFLQIFLLFIFYILTPAARNPFNALKLREALKKSS